MQSKKYKGILIDLDNTLYGYDSIHHLAMKNLYRTVEGLGYESDYDEFEVNFQKAKKVVKSHTENLAACHNRAIYIQVYLESKGVFDPTHILSLYESYWGYFLENMNTYEDAKEFLEKNQQLPICIVTDLTTHIQLRKIKKMGVAPYIDFIVTSEESGCEKPAPKIFEMALSKIGLKREEVCFIGDSFSKDICGANNSEIDAFWIQRDSEKKEETEKYKTFSNFGELNEYF